MAGICSRHRELEPGCIQCLADLRAIFPNWDEKLAEAEAAGKYTCKCGFVYYKTVDSCPLCNRPMSADEEA